MQNIIALQLRGGTFARVSVVCCQGVLASATPQKIANALGSEAPIVGFVFAAGAELRFALRSVGLDGIASLA